MERTLLTLAFAIGLLQVSAIHLQEAKEVPDEPIAVLSVQGNIAGNQAPYDTKGQFEQQTEVDKEHKQEIVDEKVQEMTDQQTAERLQVEADRKASITGALTAKLPTTEEGMITHQFWRPEPDSLADKRTPGASCSSFNNCGDCTGASSRTLEGISGVCMWVKAKGVCLEDRHPEAVDHGSKFCGPYKTVEQHVLDSVMPAANENEDYQLFSHGKDPLGFSIASLNHGQDMYTVAKDEMNPHDAADAEGFGAEIIDGAPHSEFGPVTDKSYNALDAGKSTTGTFSTTSAQPAAPKPPPPATRIRSEVIALVPI